MIVEQEIKGEAIMLNTGSPPLSRDDAVNILTLLSQNQTEIAVLKKRIDIMSEILHTGRRDGSA